MMVDIKITVRVDVTGDEISKELRDKARDAIEAAFKDASPELVKIGLRRAGFTAEPGEAQ